MKNNITTTVNLFNTNIPLQKWGAEGWTESQKLYFSTTLAIFFLKFAYLSNQPSAIWRGFRMSEDCFKNVCKCLYFFNDFYKQSKLSFYTAERPHHKNNIFRHR